MPGPELRGLVTAEALLLGILGARVTASKQRVVCIPSLVIATVRSLFAYFGGGMSGRRPSGELAS